MMRSSNSPLAGFTVVFALFVPIAGSSGCGAARQAAEQAELVALYTDNVRQEAERFSRARDDIATARLRNITLLERSALEAEEGVEYELELLRFAGDDARLLLYEGVLEATDRAVERRDRMARLRQEQEEAVDRIRGRVEIRIAKLRAASRALAQLTAEPEFRDQLVFYRGFFTEVQDQLSEMRARLDADARRTLEEAEGARPATAPPDGS